MAKKVKASKFRTQTGNQANNQQMYIVAGIVLVAIVMVGGFIFLNQQRAGPVVAIGESETFGGIPIGGQFASAREVERGADVAEGVEQGLTEDGIPYIGDPNAAIVIGEMADFTCPYCMEYSPTVDRLIKDFARNGDMLFYYLPTPASTRAPASTNAARAAVCAAEQGGFWEMHDEIFRIHRAESAAAFSSMAKLEDMANDIGLDGSAMRSCINTNMPDATLQAAEAIALETRANATPTMVYRLRGQTRWQTLPSSDGGIGGGRDYNMLAQLIRQANESGG